MKVRRRARLDPSQIQDRRGISGGGIAVGGGGIGLIIAIVIVAVNAFGGDASVLEDLSGVTVGSGQSSQPLDCQTGADAQDREDCRIVAYVNSIQDYWDGQVRNYQEAPTVFFTDQTSSGC